MFQVRTAERKNVRLKVAMFGPSGTGKTMSALRFAKGLVGDWEKVCVLDTENNSAQLYSHLGPYKHCSFPAPFSPKRYVEAIHTIARDKSIQCLIIDSISHEWEGVGGCLRMQESFGGRFNDWAKVTPHHLNFIDAIVQAPCHVISTARSKMDYVIDKDDKNKTKVQKVGLKSVTREGFDYEMTLAFQINHSHYAAIDKDRTGLFGDRVPFIISEETGKEVRDWNNQGAEEEVRPEPEPRPKVEPKQMESADVSDYQVICGMIERLTSKFTNKERLTGLREIYGFDTRADLLSLSPDKQAAMASDLATLNGKVLDAQIAASKQSQF